MDWKYHFSVYSFWCCGRGSHDSVFYIPIFGNRNYDKKWFRYTIIPIWKIGKFCYDLKMWVYYRFYPKHRYHIIKTHLEPNYYDCDTLMLYGCMALLKRYVDDECGGIDELDKWTQELIDSPKEHSCPRQVNNQKEAAAIYRWWKNRPNREKEIEDELMSCGKNYEKYWEMGDKLEKEDHEMLHRLIDIRQSLWT